jgi:F420-non-reducing hydrogenase iron-sulfur subunit
MANGKPKIVVFCCNWSVYPGLQLSRLAPSLVDEAEVEPIVTMCSGRVNPELVLEAFQNGAWGVMVTGCPPEECDHDGNYNARRRMTLLKNALAQLNVDPDRVQLGWYSAGESAKLKKDIGEFTGKIGQLGPLSTVQELA